jgi:hypothetical protein
MDITAQQTICPPETNPITDVKGVKDVTVATGMKNIDIALFERILLLTQTYYRKYLKILSDDYVHEPMMHDEPVIKLLYDFLNEKNNVYACNIVDKICEIFTSSALSDNEQLIITNEQKRNMCNLLHTAMNLRESCAVCNKFTINMSKSESEIDDMNACDAINTVMCINCGRLQTEHNSCTHFIEQQSIAESDMLTYGCCDKCGICSSLHGNMCENFSPGSYSKSTCTICSENICSHPIKICASYVGYVGDRHCTNCLMPKNLHGATEVYIRAYRNEKTRDIMATLDEEYYKIIKDIEKMQPHEALVIANYIKKISDLKYLK